MEVYDLKLLNQLLIDNLSNIRNLDFDVIVHLPRSGTIPASLLSTYLAKPLASLDEYISDMVNTRKSDFKDLNKILLVDDSINRGIQMSQAIEKLLKAKPSVKYKTLFVFSNEKGVADRPFKPDMVLFKHGFNGEPYMMPWFMFKTKNLSLCALDMDGVLCRDCTKEEDDDGSNYLKFLNSADLKFRPRHKVGAIITARLEKYRPQTEAWLSKHGIQYDRLIMGKWKSKDERKKNDVGLWKSSEYKKLNLTLFIESDIRQSRTISADSGKNVWCIDSQEFFKKI